MGLWGPLASARVTYWTMSAWAAFSHLAPWGLIFSAGRDLSAKAHWLLEGGVGCKLLRVYF